MAKTKDFAEHLRAKLAADPELAAAVERAGRDDEEADMDTTSDGAGPAAGEPAEPKEGDRFFRRVNELSHYGWATYQFYRDPSGIIFPQVVARGLTEQDARLLAHGGPRLAALEAACREVVRRFDAHWEDAPWLRDSIDAARAALAGGGAGEGGA